MSKWYFGHFCRFGSFRSFHFRKNWSKWSFLAHFCEGSKWGLSGSRPVEGCCLLDLVQKWAHFDQVQETGGLGPLRRFLGIPSKVSRDGLISYFGVPKWTREGPLWGSFWLLNGAKWAFLDGLLDLLKSDLQVESRKALNGTLFEIVADFPGGQC